MEHDADSTGRSWAEPITFAAYPGEKPVFDASCKLNSRGKWRHYRGHIWRISLHDMGVTPPDTEYIKRRMKRGRVARYFGALWPQAVYPNGPGVPFKNQLGLTRSRASRWYLSSSISQLEGYYGEHISRLDKPGEYTYDHEERVLYVWMPGNDDPNNHEFWTPYYPLNGSNELDYNAAKGIHCRSGTQYLIFRGLTILGTPQAPLAVRRSDHVLIEGCELGWTQFNCTSCAGHDFTVIDCEMHHGNYNAIQVTNRGSERVDDFRWIANNCHHFSNEEHWSTFSFGGESYGINLSGSDRAFIHQNIFDNFHFAGGRKGGGVVHETWNKDPSREAYRTIFSCNRFTNNSVDIRFQGKNGARTREAIIRDNVFENCSAWSIRMEGDNLDHRVHSNIWRNTGRGAFHAGIQVSGNLPSGGVIWGNKLIRDATNYDISIEVAPGNTVARNEVTEPGNGQ